MGIYNIVTAPADCRVCGLVSARDLQLHYGEKRMHRYQVGDRLLWGSVDGVRVGDPEAPRVWCACYAAAPYPGCDNDDDRPEFAIVIEESVISAVFQAPRGWVRSAGRWCLTAPAVRVGERLQVGELKGGQGSAWCQWCAGAKAAP